MERPNLKELFYEYKDMIVSNAIGTAFVLLLVVIFLIAQGYVRDHCQRNRIKGGTTKALNVARLIAKSR